MLRYRPSQLSVTDLPLWGTPRGFKFVIGTILIVAFFGIILVLPNSSTQALVGSGPFDPRRIPVEMQSWWTPNFGHIHAATRLPVGQEVSGTLKFDVRIVLHNNPSHLRELSIADDDGFRQPIPLGHDCPYDGVNDATCAFNVPVSLDTTGLRDGWRELRIRAVTETPDGKRFLNSSGVPVNVQNGGPDSDYDRFCNNTSLIGRGWYEGFDYTNAIIECVPLEPIAGVHTFRVRAQKSSVHLTVALDKTHFVPAVGPWPAQQAQQGQILFDQDGNFGSFFPITIDTQQLADGWHSLAVTSTSPDRGTSDCSYCQGEINHQRGVAKIWFYVQNAGSTPPTTEPPTTEPPTTEPPTTEPPTTEPTTTEPTTTEPTTTEPTTTEPTTTEPTTTEPTITEPSIAATPRTETAPSTASTTPPPVHDGVCRSEPMPFLDVPASSFAFADIACIYGLGITTGTSATTYSPDKFVTREQMAAFLARTVRALNGVCPRDPTPFLDVTATSFAAADIACIYGLGITTGTSPITYSPDDFVTREQMAALLARTVRMIRAEKAPS